MKLDCDVVRDLLPLYHDKVCSEKSKNLVEAHLSECSDCREYLQDMDEELKLGDLVEEAQPLKKVEKRLKHMRLAAFGAGLIAAALFIFLGWMGLAKYSVFIHHLLYLLIRGLKMIVPLMVVLVLVTLGIRRRYQKQGKVFPWKKAVLWMLLAGWVGMYLYVTVFQHGYGSRHWNLQPFLMLREALNRFTPQMWLNILMNILVFVPFGVLLPLLFSKQQKWYWALLTGFGAALGFELLQLLTAQGICDIDDVILDSLGTMLGWSGTMLVLSFRNREGAKSLRYLALPAASLLTAGIIFGTYYLKPYGNFPEGPVRKPDLSQISWNLKSALKSNTETAPVYKVGRVTREASERFAEEFAQRLCIEFPDTYYEDSMIIYADHSTGDFLTQYYQDGSWDYSVGRDHAPQFEDLEAEQDKLLDELNKMGISVPEDAKYILDDSDSDFPEVTIQINMVSDDAGLRHGEIICMFSRRDGILKLWEVINSVFTLEPVQDETIISSSEAYDRLTKGKSFYGTWIHKEEKELTISDCVLDWKTDTKGFFQPVYRFTLTNEETGSQWADYVPALS